MSTHHGALSYHQAFPSADDEPTYFTQESDQVTAGHVATLQLDSMGCWRIYPPSAAYLRKLAVKATALADAIDEARPGWER